MRTITIGADPELFAFNGSTPVSVHDLLPGTKYSPLEIPKGAIQVDGVAAEFNIKPAKTKKEFLENIKHVKKIMLKILNNKNKDLTLHAIPTVLFTQSYFDSLPDEAKALGCEPDFNAYTQQANPKPESTKPMRTGSGHVHIGWSDCDPNSDSYMPLCFELVQELDFLLYRQSSAWDKDLERQELYGKPGAFRFKKYGLEYRVLSNRWLNDERLVEFVFDASKNITTRVLNGERFAKNFQNQCSYENYLKLRRLPIINEYINAA